MTTVTYLTESHTILEVDRGFKLNPPSTATGYGNKLATRYRLKLQAKDGSFTCYRQVWAVCWSNVASHYVILNDKRLYLHDSDIPSESEAAAKTTTEQPPLSTGN